MKTNYTITALALVLPLITAVGMRDAHAWVHPGLLNNSAELEFIKEKVKAGIEPWKSGYAKMQSFEGASLSHQPKARAVVQVGPYTKPDIGGTDMRRDAGAIYAHALQWYITGNEAHAQKAIQLLKAWSDSLQKIELSNAPLQAGWSVPPMVRGAEILRHTYPKWAKSDQAAFIAMLNRAMWPLIKNTSAHNKGWGGNWGTSMIEAILSIAVFTEDTVRFNTGVKAFKDHLPVYVLADGESGETCRDLQHTQYGLAGLAQIAEIAWKQGIDLYGELDNRLLKGAEFHAKYLLGAPVPADLCGGTLKDVNPRVMWEITDNHYHNRKGLKMPLSEKVMLENRPEGITPNLLVEFAWGTLTHADLPPFPTGSVGMRLPRSGPFRPKAAVNSFTSLHDLQGREMPYIGEEPLWPILKGKSLYFRQ